jgi:3-hydroxyisobutyrate dehydrogenase
MRAFGTNKSTPQKPISSIANGAQSREFGIIVEGGMRYGFVGLGHLGRHLAGSLIKAGFDVTVNDLDPQNASSLIEAGAAWAADPQAAAEKTDTVITCLPSPKVSEAVLAGPRGILAGMKPGSTWIEMSTLSSGDVERLAALAAAKGVRMMEAPVTGGVHKAASGEITVIAGGDKDLFDLHRPALEAMGGEIFHAGPLGKAAVIKVITNMLAFIHLIATGEALMLAKKGGIDLTDAFNIIKASSGNSFVHETEGQVILNGSYNINFTMDLAVKDLGFALGFGKEFGVPLDLASHAMQTFIRAKAQYGGSAWSSQVVKLLEDATGTDLRAPGFPAEL